jgi:hypothetical protein
MLVSCGDFMRADEALYPNLSALIVRNHGEEGQILPFFSANATPEGQSGLVRPKHKQVALIDTRTTKRCQAPLEQGCSDATAAMVRRNSEMMNEAAPTIVSTKDGAD